MKPEQSGHTGLLSAGVSPGCCAGAPALLWQMRVASDRSARSAATAAGRAPALAMTTWWRTMATACISTPITASTLSHFLRRMVPTYSERAITLASRFIILAQTETSQFARCVTVDPCHVDLSAILPVFLSEHDGAFSVRETGLRLDSPGRPPRVTGIDHRETGLQRLLRRLNRFRVLASVVTLLAVLTHGLMVPRHAGAMTAAPSAYGSSEIDAVLAADLQIICHSGGLELPQDGKSSKEQRGSCPLCQSVCKHDLVLPSSSAALFAPLLQKAPVTRQTRALVGLRWPQRPSPGRGPPLHS